MACQSARLKPYFLSVGGDGASSSTRRKIETLVGDRRR
jgi:hypothetical protein